ncbi:unnamed protein product, partial [Rotaria sp. Silwood1]
KTNTAPYKKVSQRLSTIKEEVGDATKLTRPLGYRPPAILRKRTDTDVVRKEKVFQADT